MKLGIDTPLILDRLSRCRKKTVCVFVDVSANKYRQSGGMKDSIDKSIRDVNFPKSPCNLLL